jgi:hypothetical protein
VVKRVVEPYRRWIVVVKRFDSNPDQAVPGLAHEG